MISRFETLTVAVACKLEDGGYSVGTGVPVARGIVLTARHVVLPDKVADSPVRVRFWHATERDFAPDPLRNFNGFVDAVGDSGGEAEARRGVVWSSAALDSALVAVHHPPSIGIAPLASTEPYNDAAWSMEAFPHASWELGAPEPVRLTGKSHSRVPNKSRYQVDAEIAMRDGGVADAVQREGWSGASGAALFVNGQVMGILLSRKPNGEARILSAVPVVDLLADQQFCALLGLTERRGNPYDAALEEIMSELPPFTHQRLATMLALPATANGSELARMLAALPLDRGIAMLADLKCASDERLICEIALRYAACCCAPPDPESLRAMAFAREANFDRCAAGSRMGAEFLMAATERRIPQFLEDRGRLPPGRYALPRLPEAGSGEGVTAISVDLEARIGADLLRTESWLEDTIGPVCDFPVDSPPTAAARREILQFELSYRAGGDQQEPSYYFAEPDPGSSRAAERTALGARIAKIRESYPQIGAVYIRPDLAPQEFARFRPLIPLLPLEANYERNRPHRGPNH